MYRNIVFSINLPENCSNISWVSVWIADLWRIYIYIYVCSSCKKDHKFIKYVYLTVVWSFLYILRIKKIPKTSFHNIQSIQTSKNLVIQDTILGVDLFECADHIVTNLDRSTAISCRKILGFMSNQNDETKTLKHYFTYKILVPSIKSKWTVYSQ